MFVFRTTPPSERPEAGVEEQLERLDTDKREALHAAVKSGDMDDMLFLIRNGAELENKDRCFRTALMYAAELGRAEMVAKLIECGAAVHPDVDWIKTPLMFAAEAGHLEVVEELIKRGANVDFGGKAEKQPLVYAAERGYVHVVKELIRAGAGVDLKIRGCERTALSFAAEFGRLDVITELARCGADVDSKDRTGRTPLSFAAGADHLDVVSELIQRGANPNVEDNDGKTALIHAAWNNHVASLAKLVKSVDDVNVQDHDGRTALLYGAWHGHLDVVVVLLHEKKLAIDTADKCGRTALSFAAAAGYINIVEELIRKGANVNSEDNGGRAVLSFAASAGRLDVAVELIRSRANVYAADSTGKTALMYAAWNGRADVVAELIKYVSSVDVQDHDGRTALVYAAWYGYGEVVVELLRKSATPNTKGKGGRSALSLAAESSHADVVSRLLQYGAKVNDKDDSGKTALLHAARQGHVEVVAELIKQGADVDATDGNGATALLLAAVNDRLDVVTALLENGTDVTKRDGDGKTALDYAVKYKKKRVLAELLRFITVVDRSSYSSDKVALFAAAALGDTVSVTELIKKELSVDEVTKDGRTPLFYAAEYGRTDAVLLLIENGASVTPRPALSHSHRAWDSPLTLAGRAGHMDIFKMLVGAGASVNVRGGGSDGETPLMSTARWGFFAGVQLLVAHGGALRFEDVSSNEYPLIPGTLETMKTMCAATHEFTIVCTRVLDRLLDICSQLQARDVPSERQENQEEALTSLCSIVFRFCSLLFKIERRRSPLLRFIGSRAILSSVQDIHRELDQFETMFGSSQGGDSWTSLLKDDQALIRERQLELLSTGGALVEGCEHAFQKTEMAVLLQFELNACRGEEDLAEKESVSGVLERFIRVCRIESPVVPAWFVSRDEMEYHAWSIVRSENGIDFFEGEWRATRVTIETSYLDVDSFVKSVSRWSELSHPHVVPLLGACHIRSPKLLMYELAPGAKQLHDFLSEAWNQQWRLKCLYQAALGLQHLHHRGVIHGDLRSENIIVSPDLTTKLCGLRDNPHLFTNSERDLDDHREMPSPYFDRIDSAVSAASDIYAFGMCMLETLVRDLNVEGMERYEKSREKTTPRRPSGASDAEWNLITIMCASNPDHRADINYVVDQLWQIMSSRTAS